MSKIPAIVAAAVFLAGAGEATVLLPADLGELSRNARLIARGRVAATDARWTGDHRRIETVVTLEPENLLKGSHNGELQFTVPGGELGRYRSIVLGAPHFVVGQRVVVFLAGRDTVPYLLGWAEGVFRVVESANGAVVTPPPNVRVPQAAAPRGFSARIPLTSFEQIVRGFAGGAR